MGDLVAALHLGDTGPWALITLIVLLILGGRLVTRQQVTDLREDRDHWREAATGWQKTATELGMSVEKLTAQGEATNHALNEIQDALDRGVVP